MPSVWLAYLLLGPLLVLLLAAVIAGTVVMAVCIGIWSLYDVLADFIESKGYKRPNIPNLPW